MEDLWKYIVGFILTFGFLSLFGLAFKKKMKNGKLPKNWEDY
jgi:hypothetical protein